MKNFLLLIVFVVGFVFCLLAQTNPNHEWVDGYYRNDGTYVKGHYKTAKNDTNADNFSTEGNTNPYTGELGWIEKDNGVNPYANTLKPNGYKSNSDKVDNKPYLYKWELNRLMENENISRNEFLRILKKATTGNGEAACLVGKSYEYGLGTEKDLEQAIEFYTASLSRGYDGALNPLTRVFRKNREFEKAFLSYEYYVELYKSGVLELNAEIYYYLGLHYYLGFHCDKDELKAIDFMKIAAKNGFPEAKDFMNGNQTAKNDTNTDNFSTEGNINSHTLEYGWIESDGKKNPWAITNDETKKIDLDHLNKIGNYKMRGDASISLNDFSSAFEMYYKCAELGDSECQLLVGSFYELGKGTFQDAAEAALWYERSALQGNDKAMNFIGNLSFKDKLYEKSAYWYTKATKLGNKNAMYTLGLYYLEGLIVEKNWARGSALIEQSAEKGLVDAQEKLGILYCIGGAGFSKDLTKASYWIKKAFVNGSDYAKIIWDTYELWKYE